MSREVVHTDNAPAAMKVYSQAIKANGMVFTAGQIALDPTTMKLVEGGIKEQTHQVLTNVKAVLEGAGSSLEKVVKVTVFLAHIEDFAAMNEVYGEFFTSEPPARSAFAVANLPLGALVEIETIALQ